MVIMMFLGYFAHKMLVPGERDRFNGDAQADEGSSPLVVEFIYIYVRSDEAATSAQSSVPHQRLLK